MTDNEVVKAALKCSNGLSCDGCLYNERGCRGLVSALLAIYNRQQAEVEKLKAMVNAELDTIHSLGDDCERVLEEEQDLVKNAKAEAIREFAERLKEEKVWDADTRCGYVQVVDVGDIENLVEEMVGE